MSFEPIDRTKILKLVMLATSPNDNEALAAFRKATALLKTKNISWAEFLSKPPSTSESLPNTPPSYRREKTIRWPQDRIDEWESVIQDCLYSTKNERSREFLRSVLDQLLSKGFLTPKQQTAINKFS